MATHYQILGVHSHSDLASIRAAYLTLMRRYHPDSPQRTNAMNNQEIYRINQAYSVLRDRSKRAAYDSQLLRQRMQRVPLPPGRRFRIVVPRRQRVMRALPYLWAVLPVAFLSVAGDQLASWPATSSRHGAVAGTSSALYQESQASDRLAEPVDLNLLGVREAADLAGAESLPEARVSSFRCFAHARTIAAASAADLCIAFDIAFAYWHEGEFRGTLAEAYFLPQMLELRHRSALSSLPSEDARARVASIRSAVFTTLIESVRGRGAPSSAPLETDLPGQNYGIDDFAERERTAAEEQRQPSSIANQGDSVDGSEIRANKKNETQ